MSAIKEYKGFKLEVGAVANLVFTGPVSIFSTPVLKDFIKALGELTESVRVLVITGSNNTFMAGGDIKEMSAFTPEEAVAYSTLFHSAMDRIEALSRPVIAAVNGFALGGGCELALACDFVIASDLAVFGSPEIALGIIPGAGGTRRLTERVGRLKAKEMVFTGRRVYASEALAIGLVNRVASRDEFAGEVRRLAEVLAAKPPQCLAAAKRLINNDPNADEKALFGEMFSFDDQKHLMKKFLDKKK